MDIVNENSAQLCEYSSNSQFHLNDNAPINPSLNSIHVGPMSCGDQVVNSMSEINIPVSIDTNLDVNKNISGHLLNNNTTHISKESNGHDNEEDSGEEGDTSKDSDGDDTVSYSKFKPTGTNDDFDNILMDFRQCEKQAFLRGLVKDRRITEIVIGASDVYSRLWIEIMQTNQNIGIYMHS